MGTGEQLLDFIITTTEAQSSNPRMQELLSKKKTSNMKFGSSSYETPKSQKEEVEFLFVLDCEDFEIENHNLIVDKRGNRKLAPVIAFVDPSNPTARIS